MFIYEKTGLKTLPYTNNRFVFNDEHKVVYDKLTKQLIKPDFSGNFHLEDTIYGALDYEVLWLLTHKPIHMDLIDFLRVYPEFTKLTIVSNPNEPIGKKSRFWKFDRIESRTFKGHFYIPGFTRYVINEKGIIHSLVTGETLSIHKAKNGYPSVRLVRDDGKEVIMYLHRLLVATFKDWSYDAHELTVDHLNGDKTDFDLNNLELVTKTENNRRAVLNGFYKADKEPEEIFLRDMITGETGTYFIINDLALAIGVNRTTVLHHLKKPRENGLIKGRYFVAYRKKNARGKYIDGFTGDLGTNYFTDMSKFRLREGSQPRPVLVKDILDNTIVRYESVVLMLEATGLSRKQAYDNLKKSTQKRYGNIIFKYEDDVNDWLF